MRGTSVYLLNTLLRGAQGQRVGAMLPCPEAELMQWLAASQQNITGEQLHNLIRCSPTLLLIAVSRAVDCTGAPVQSMVQLFSRLEHCFGEGNPVETALGHVVDVQQRPFASLGWDVEHEAALKKFRRARDRHSLTKSLSRLIRQVNKLTLSKSDRPGKMEVRNLVDSMFAESFRIQRVKNSGTKWPEDVSQQSCRHASAAISGLLNERQAAKTRFEDKLLQAKLAAMKQLAYGASHEINNPLANVATRAHTILAQERDPDRRFQLAVIHEQAMRAHDMISDMMLFAHPPALNIQCVDVRLMIGSLIRECEANLFALLKSGASLSATVCKQVDRAMLDPTQVKVALASLIQNAAEAIRHDEGEIEIRISVRGESLCFAVSDDGVGVSDSVQQHLFDPFYSGREAGRGLGFGLPKSWRIARLHGGNLTHRVDAENLRTVFELSLPLRNSAVSEPAFAGAT